MYLHPKPQYSHKKEEELFRVIEQTSHIKKNICLLPVLCFINHLQYFLPFSKHS